MVLVFPNAKGDCEMKETPGESPGSLCLQIGA
jgi:hypothetical protein